MGERHLTRIFHCSNVAGVIRSAFVSNPVVVVGKGIAVRTSPFPPFGPGVARAELFGGYGGTGTRGGTSRRPAARRKKSGQG